jgi:hypothetical protein
MSSSFNLQAINDNKYAWGIALLLLNVGSRYLATDLGKFHEAVLSNDLVKRFVLFSLFFVATRDVLIALTLTLVFSVIVYGFLHEKSRFSLVPDKKCIRDRMNEFFTPKDKLS